ncbi:SDR family NAD(P)-dependent oxidoreductase [Streptomyces gibsoniae]|uniref:SDR family NAD(P)-dependent oxidoreductase n=1 Tax=Streptomyces gibsoniae TaxID=3075529 RepID=A0ABU2U7E8_9ACTN|nr:SDR family NAD(P)-dependent oxidoreductase [Streptomyces sp. DSM 41699]MDT0469104.1 SDR family NAD(P)-dependent oxidoreductase [Streptomyces sp. DSM 41699]
MTHDRITSSFDAASTAAEVVDGIDLHGKRMIVTGGSSGIGIETARALATAGADVVIAVRNPQAGHGVADDINTGLDSPRVTVSQLDLADLPSIRRFATEWGRTPVHALIDNAGIMATPLTRTASGREVQFATNHLGHFALASALHDALAAANGARIVSVSSRGHLRSPVVFDDIHFTERAYDPWLAYGQSKTANVLFAVGATRRWADDGITANALHPGGIWTNLVRHLPEDVLEGLRTDPTAVYKTPEQGAATSVFVATSPLLDGVGGRYFEDCNQAVPYEGGPERVGVADYALDPEAAQRLWDVSAHAISS